MVLKMSLLSMGAASASDKETRVLRLKAYLNGCFENTRAAYNSAYALKKAHVYSFATLSNYLNIIRERYWDSLTDNGKQNWKIAKREAELLRKANQRAKRYQR